MKVRNLTPHSITIHGNNRAVTVPPDGIVVRCKINAYEGEPIVLGGEDIPITHITMGEVEGLPPYKGGTILVVSQVVATQCVGRPDVYYPGELIRNEEGMVVGCNGLSQRAS